MRRLVVVIGFFCFFSTTVVGQYVTVSGKVVDGEKKAPVEFASVLLEGHDLWAVTDDGGAFSIRRVPLGEVTLTVRCLGYAKRSLRIRLVDDVEDLRIELDEDNLKLNEVEVVAKRKSVDLTTAYVIDRTTLDNQQLLNLSDLSVLLPGGKTVNSTLLNDDRLSLRSNTSEKGNASFGTAVEIDGMRLANNAMMGETSGVSTRSISSSNIESVEIITGIPSVEYGDLSNGVVKVHTRKGKSPFIIEGKLTQHTYQLAVHKGLELSRNGGLLNISLERARSFSDIASPHTAYQRNNVSLNYMNVFMKRCAPLTLNVSVTGNIGGYDSKSDPDNNLDSYNKVRDYVFRSHVNLNWLLNKTWITNIGFNGSFSYQDREGKNYEKVGSASAQPFIHTMEEGYFVATDYDVDPNANIILSPIGAWYQKRFDDEKPIDYSLKLQAGWIKRFDFGQRFSISGIINKLLAGAELKGSGNEGLGTYYEDMRYAPTWRPYRYDALPWMHNLAVYFEDKITVFTSNESSERASRSALQLTMGIRSDFTKINGSNYNNVSSVSPRFNGKYTFWRNRKAWVSDLSIHAGWGRSVKLPSFQVLYPVPSYSDYLAFTPGSTSDNKSYYAYYTFPSKAIYNPNLKWQYTHQTDMGVEMKLKGTRISLSAFYHKTFRPYMSVYDYAPFQYVRTSQSAIEGCGVPAAYRSYSIDPHTGIVTLTDLSGKMAPQELSYTTQRTYKSSMMYVNGSPVERYGLEWIVDFAPFKLLRTSLRVDGNYYHYRGLDETLFAGGTTGSGSTDDTIYPLIGYYRGSSSTTAGMVSSGSIANGSESSQVNMNITLTTHIPKVRMILSLRLESSLYNYKRSLSRLSNGSRGVAVGSTSDYFGVRYDDRMRDQYVVVYPEYYSTWDNPSEKIPFAEKFEWAHANDQELYNQLARLVVRNNYAYTLNPNYVSKYFSANFSVTKEIGDHISLSFYANNFFNNMGHVKSSQTGLKSSLFDSGYIPKFYYGLSLRIKI